MYLFGGHVEGKSSVLIQRIPIPPINTGQKLENFYDQTDPNTSRKWSRYEPEDISFMQDTFLCYNYFTNLKGEMFCCGEYGDYDLRLKAIVDPKPYSIKLDYDYKETPKHIKPEKEGIIKIKNLSKSNPQINFYIIPTLRLDVSLQRVGTEKEKKADVVFAERINLPFIDGATGYLLLSCLRAQSVAKWITNDTEFKLFEKQQESDSEEETLGVEEEKQ